MTLQHHGSGTLQAMAPLVSHTLSRVGLGQVVLMSRLQRHWKEIVGPQLVAVTQPENIRSQVLFVTVSDAIWLQQMMFYQSQVLANIRRVLGEVAISRLHFALAAASSRGPASAGDTARSGESEPEVVPDSVRLTLAEEELVRSGTEGIADPELREVIQRTWRRDWQVRRRET